MVSGSSPEWLPPGFTEKVKYKNGRKIKYYSNNTTGAKYYSKKDVMHCATAETDLLGKPQTTNGDDDKGDSPNAMVDAELDKKNDSSQGLPEGLIMEEKPEQDCSIDGSSYKLDNADELCEDTPDPVSQENSSHISEKKRRVGSFKMVAIETTVDADLPPGWIKEVQTSKFGHRVRKDPFYIDPASGYVFRSKKDALRYLETNDIRSCVCRPLKREFDDLKLIMNEIPSSDPVNEKSSNNDGHLSPVEESNDGRGVSGTKDLAEFEAEILKEAQDLLDHVKVTSVGASSCEGFTLVKDSSKNDEMESNLEQADEVPQMDLETGGASNSSPVKDPAPITSQLLSENAVGKQSDSAQTGSRKSKKRGNASATLRTSKRLARSEPDILPRFDLSERSLRAAVRKSSGREIATSPVLKESASIPLQSDGNTVSMCSSVFQDSVDIPLQREEITAVMSPPILKESDSISLQHYGSTVAVSAPVLKQSDNTPLPPDIEPAKAAADHDPTSKGTVEGAGLVNEFEKLHSEEPASEKQLNSSKRPEESPFSFDFGESWSDPLEFAVKTLRGELSIEDTLRFTGLLNKPNEVVPDNRGNESLKSSQSVPEVPPNVQNEFPPLSRSFEQFNTPYSQRNDFFRPSQPGVSISFQNEFASQTESWKKNDTVQQFPAYPPSFPAAPGNPMFPAFGGFNTQSSKDAGKKKDCPTK